MGRGRDTLPLQPYPKNKTKAIYTEKLTHLFTELEPIGISGRLQYAYSRVRFIGPITGGLADEALESGEAIPPAFD